MKNYIVTIEIEVRGRSFAEAAHEALNELVSGMTPMTTVKCLETGETQDVDTEDEI